MFLLHVLCLDATFLHLIGRLSDKYTPLVGFIIDKPGDPFFTYTRFPIMQFEWRFHLLHYFTNIRVFYCCPADHLPQNNPFEHGPKECQHLLLLMACDKAQYKSKWVRAYVKIHDATENHYHRQYYLMIQYTQEISNHKNLIHFYF